MIYPSLLLGKLDYLPNTEWKGTVFRYTFGQRRPDRENRTGARWNPPDVPAIYSSLEKHTLLTEADHYVGLQPVRPSYKGTIYSISLHISNALDLTDWGLLASLGVYPEVFSSMDYAPTQLIGGAAARIGRDGLIVPSARGSGKNLVVLPQNHSSDYRFDIRATEEVEPTAIIT